MWIPEIKASGDIKYPCACEVKIDGEFIFWNGSKFVNKRKNEKRCITVLPAIPLYGELYYGDGKSFYSELHSHQGYNNLFVAFDTEHYGVKPYVERREWLDKHPDIPSVPYHICYDKRQVEEFFKEISDKAYEGIVIKPLNSLTDKTWVKMKREFSATLLIKGIRKDRKDTIAVGTEEEVLGYCSLLGWDIVKAMLVAEDGTFYKEDKECLYLNSEIKLEIAHNGIIPVSHKLRHPRIKRVKDPQEKIEV